MANTPMYQTGPSDGGFVGILSGATTALGGITAELEESRKAQLLYNDFADVLESQGLIGDAMIYRSAAKAERPNFIQAAKTGQAAKRDFSVPFKQALGALSDREDRRVRLATSDGSSLSRQRAIYNAEDEIDAADLGIITSEINGIDNQLYTLDQRLSQAEKTGDLNLVRDLEQQRQDLNKRREDLQGQMGAIQGKRRSRASSAFAGDPMAPPLPEQHQDREMLGPEGILVGPGTEMPGAELPFGPDDNEPQGIISPKTINEVPARRALPVRNATDDAAMANAFAGNKPRYTNQESKALATAFVGDSGTIIPAKENPTTTESVTESLDNRQLAELGRLDYTKNLGLPPDASVRQRRTKLKFLEKKQQAYIQVGHFDEAIDKAQTPEALTIALNEALRLQRKQTGLTSEAEAYAAGESMRQAMGADGDRYLVKVIRKGENNFDVSLDKKGSASVSKVGNVWTVGGKIFTSDENGATVKVNPYTGEQEPVYADDPDNPNKRLSFGQFESKMTEFSPERIAEVLGISIEEARALSAKLVQGNQKALNKGAEPLVQPRQVPSPGNSVYQQFRNQ